MINLRILQVGLLLVVMGGFAVADSILSVEDATYERELFNLSSTLLLPINGTSPVMLNDSTAMIYSSNCSANRMYLYYNSSTAITGTYNSSYTGCTWFSSYPTQIDANHNITGLIQYFTFDEPSGSVAFDSSGYGRDGSIVSSPTMDAPGAVYKSYTFDGVDDTISLQTPSLGTGNFTVCAWIDPDTSLTNENIWGQWQTFGKVQLLRDNWDKINFNFYMTSSPLHDFAVITDFAVISTGWSHVCVERTGGTNGSIYINGSLVPSTLTINGDPISLGSTYYFIGSINDTNYFFDGGIDDFQLWTRALTSTEIAAIYNMRTSVGAENGSVIPTSTYSTSFANNFPSWNEGNTIINYTIIDTDSDTWSISPGASTGMQYSVDNATWYNATEGSSEISASEGLTGLSSSISGISHIFVWDSLTDLPAITNDSTVYLRVAATNGTVTTNWSYSSSFGIYNNPLTNWTRYPGNPIFVGGASGKWDEYYVYDIRILKYTNGTAYRDAQGNFYMYYIGSGPTTGIDNDQSGLALSKNLYNWTRYDIENPVLPLGSGGTWDDADVQAESWIYDGGTFHSWYIGNSNEALDATQIGYANSTDGKTWTKYASNPILAFGGVGASDRYDLYHPIVIKDGSTWKMWYTGHDTSTGGNYGVMYATATSPQGPWTKYGTSYIFHPFSTGATSVWKEGEMYLMIYENWDTMDELRLASSDDGLNWIDEGKLFGSGTGWETDIYGASQIFIDDTWYNYYTGFNSTRFYGVGLAPSTQRYNITLLGCTPNLVNTSWGSWTNYTDACIINGTYEQISNLTQYDNNSCGGANQTFYRYQWLDCDCDVSMAYTEWTDWANTSTCQVNDTVPQSRSRVYYDENECGEVDNVTSYEYQEVACQGAAPTITWDWDDLNSDNTNSLTTIICVLPSEYVNCTLTFDSVDQTSSRSNHPCWTVTALEGNYTASVICSDSYPQDSNIVSGWVNLTPYIEPEFTGNMRDIGSGIGGFFTGIGPGLFYIILAVGVGSFIIALFAAIKTQIEKASDE